MIIKLETQESVVVYISVSYCEYTGAYLESCKEGAVGYDRGIYIWGSYSILP